MADLCIWSASPCIFVPAHQSLGATSRLVSDSRLYSHFWPLPLKCALLSWALDALVHFFFFFFFFAQESVAKISTSMPLVSLFSSFPFPVIPGILFVFFFLIWTPDKFFWSQEFTFFLFLYLFGSTGSQLQQVGALIFVEACRIFSYSMKTLSCGLWDLVPC